MTRRSWHVLSWKNKILVIIELFNDAKKLKTRNNFPVHGVISSRNDPFRSCDHKFNMMAICTAVIGKCLFWVKFEFDIELFRLTIIAKDRAENRKVLPNVWVEFRTQTRVISSHNFGDSDLLTWVTSAKDSGLGLDTGDPTTTLLTCTISFVSALIMFNQNWVRVHLDSGHFWLGKAKSIGWERGFDSLEKKCVVNLKISSILLASCVIRQYKK